MKPPEEVKKELVRQWLGKAEQDMKAAEILLDMAPPLCGPSCFHAQQAAEKHLKAFLTRPDRVPEDARHGGTARPGRTGR